MEDKIVKFKYLGQVTLPTTYDPANSFSNLKSAVKEQLGLDFDSRIHSYLSVHSEKLGSKLVDIFEKLS